MIDTLKTLVVNLIGVYTPYTYITADDLEVIPNGASGIDWPWLIAALLFMLSFYCVFKLVGVIINAIRNE